MAQDDIRVDLYNAVAGVTMVGMVHDYERWSATWDAYLTHYRDDILEQIRGWSIGYGGFIEEEYEQGDARLRSHLFTIRGVMAVEDSEETEKTWSELAEAVADAIKDDATLQANYYRVLPAELRVELRMFGSVLCHYAELAQRVVEYVA